MKPLVILRPEPGASRTAARAWQLGLDPIMIPLFELGAIEWVAPNPSDFDAILITSANAVRFAGLALHSLRSLPALAVGEASAEAARLAGLAVHDVGTAGVEALLGGVTPGKRLLHLCGEHRREPAAGRQAITAVPVYRSAELPAPPGLKRIEGSVAAVHSPRAGRRLDTLASEAQFDKSTVALVAISEQAAGAAGTGWQGIEVAGIPGDEALLALASRLCKK